MGDLFGVALKPHNRWGGFKALRERWSAHIESTLVRPVLLVDEAQEMPPAVLSELRLLTSTRFRVLTTMAAELLAAAAHAEITQLDEKLYLEVFQAPERTAPTPRRAASSRRAR